MITVNDDSFHRRSDDPIGMRRVVLVHGSRVQHKRVGVLLHRPNMHLTAGGVSIWDATATDVPDCLFQEFDHFQPLTAAADMYEFKLENGLSVSCDEPLQAFHLEVRLDRDGQGWSPD